MDATARGGPALEQALSRMRRALVQTVHAVSTVAGHRDRYTDRHQRHTAILAVAIGRELRLDKHQLEGLYLGALVHDVGKVTVPSELLNKPGRLTPEELALVRTHVLAGCNIFESVELPWPVKSIIAQHHERLDGSGYPLGLAAGAIVLEARIVAVADVFDAMSDDRPYRAAPGRDAASKELIRCSGKSFDTDVVSALQKVLRAVQATGEQFWSELEADPTLTSTVVLPRLPRESG